MSLLPSKCNPIISFNNVLFGASHVKYEQDVSRVSQRDDGAVDPGGGPARATPPATPPRTMKLSSLGTLLLLLLLLATIGPVRGQARERVELTIAGLVFVNNIYTIVWLCFNTDRLY